MPLGSWTLHTAKVRATILGLEQQEFVALARIAGCSSVTIVFRHIVPNLAIMRSARTRE